MLALTLTYKREGGSKQPFTYCYVVYRKCKNLKGFFFTDFHEQKRGQISLEWLPYLFTVLSLEIISLFQVFWTIIRTFYSATFPTLSLSKNVNSKYTLQGADFFNLAQDRRNPDRNEGIRNQKTRESVKNACIERSIE